MTVSKSRVINNQSQLTANQSRVTDNLSRVTDNQSRVIKSQSHVTGSCLRVVRNLPLGIREPAEIAEESVGRSRTPDGVVSS